MSYQEFIYGIKKDTLGHSTVGFNQIEENLIYDQDLIVLYYGLSTNSYIILGKLFNFSVPQFVICKKRDNRSPYFRGLL